MELGPVTLRGRHVTLEPLEERHGPDLFDAMRDEEVCRYLAWPPPAVSGCPPRGAPGRPCSDWLGVHSRTRQSLRADGVRSGPF
jgi:hypothetical protein